MKSLIQSIFWTVAVTFAIGLVLRFTGVMDGFYYRPNNRSYDAPSGGWPAHDEHGFESEDGTRLHGWFFTAQDPRGTILHLHGSDGNITATARNLLWLVDGGYNLFAFDYREYGRSEGKTSREGVVADSHAAYRYVRSLPGVDPDRIVLFGQSMGGQLAILTAVDQHPPAAVISEATYASYADQMFDKMEQMTFVSIFRWPMWLIADDAHSAIDVVHQLSSPLLLIHGVNDRGVRHLHSERLYHAAPEPKQLWSVEEAGHLEVFKRSPYREAYRPALEEYLRQILE